MKCHRVLWAAAVAALLGTGHRAAAGEPAAKGSGVELVAGQKEFLTHEPILVTARVTDRSGAVLRASPGDCKGKALRFEITPAVKARMNPNPLSVEGRTEGDLVTVRTFDLLEWFAFPAEGTWTVRVVVGHNGAELKSVPLKITLRRPAKGDREQAAVDRLHHLPWSNYTSNAFCGDTFDLVKQWPDSRLARYAHYWSGLYSQNKGEHAKALASFRKAASYADFPLAEHAEFGVVECLRALGRASEAAAQSEALARRLRERNRGLVSTVQLLVGQPQAQAEATGGR
jgi:hypothetical protein